MNPRNSLIYNFDLYPFYQYNRKLIYYYELTNGTFDPGARVYFHDHCWYEKDTEDVAPTNIVGPVYLINVFYLKS